MPKKKNATKVTPESIANALERVLGREIADQAAEQSKFVKRKRVLLPYALVLALVSTLGMGKADWIADILRSYNGLVEGKFLYKPFHKRLAHWALEVWMRRLLELALTHLTVPVLEPDATEKLSLFKDIIVHDGSSMAIKASLRKEYPGRFTKNSPAAVELHVSMSGFRESPQSITLVADKESERHYRTDPKRTRGCLVLKDRAYQDQSYFQQVHDAHGFFIIRGTKNIRPLIVEARDSLGRRLKTLEGRCLSQWRLPRHDVSLKIRMGIWEGRLVVLYRCGRRNQKLYTYLHTNLDHSFTITEIGKLYRFRWQVELLFKEWKSHANLHRFDTGKKAIAVGLIWASILTAVVKRYITHAAALATGSDLSTQRAAASALHYLPEIIAATAPVTASVSTAVTVMAYELISVVAAVTVAIAGAVSNHLGPRNEGMAQLWDHSQLSSLATLQATLRLAGQVLAIEHPDRGFLNPFGDISTPDDILAQLIVDRCRELSKLLTCYRRTVCPTATPLPSTANENYF
jgi:hypothetical protein